MANNFAISTVFSEAQALLNDVAKATYTDTRIAPFVKMAHREVRDRFNSLGFQTNIYIDASKLITAGTTSYPSLPDDFTAPYYMEERAVGEGDDKWIKMEERGSIPVKSQATTLDYWSFRGSNIIFLGATTNREVRLHYWGVLAPGLSSPPQGTDVVNQIHIQNFLTYRAAALAARNIGEDVDRAADLQSQAQAEMDLLLSTVAKGEQSIPVNRPARPRRF